MASATGVGVTITFGRRACERMERRAAAEALSRGGHPIEMEPAPDLPAHVTSTE